VITRILLVSISVLLVIVLPETPANAACSLVREEEMVNGQVRVHWVEHCDAQETPNAATSPIVNPPRDSDLDAACARRALSAGLDPVIFCDLPLDAAVPELTPGSVTRAFRAIDLPEAKLVIQPPNGRTLVNFETNFYTEQGEFTRTVALLGRQVELRIWPASFGWEFGDGASDQTTSPGAAYPELEITHEYLRKGRVTPSVDTTYAAQFRVGGGPWRDVAGTVTIPGSPQPLRVVEARPVLVGG
jgi:hypothetical protein